MKQKPFELVLLVDKPLNWTSFDVVNKLRYAARNITGRKKIKVGHAGTLDPLATGLMIVCIGAATKKIGELTGLNKGYTGTFKLGATTPSYDLETSIDFEYPIPVLNKEELKVIADSFVGLSLQLPPLYSAKKVEGNRAYIAARKGKSLELKPVEIKIFRFTIAAENYPEIRFELICSKGTYVRSLAYDFGKAVGSGAHLNSLRRIEIGDFKVENALSIDQSIAAIQDTFSKYENSNAI